MQDNPSGKNVYAPIDVVRHRLFGRHIGELAFERTALGALVDRFVAQRFCDTKV